MLTTRVVFSAFLNVPYQIINIKCSLFKQENKAFTVHPVNEGVTLVYGYNVLVN